MELTPGRLYASSASFFLRPSFLVPFTHSLLYIAIIPAQESRAERSTRLYVVFEILFSIKKEGTYADCGFSFGVRCIYWMLNGRILLVVDGRSGVCVLIYGDRHSKLRLIRDSIG